jgi:hypothetical protein
MTTAAMKVFLVVPPLHVMTEADDPAKIYRLMCKQQYEPKSTIFGHTKTSQDLEDTHVLQMKFDRMIPTHASYKPFMVTFPDDCDGKIDLNHILKGTWFVTCTGPRLMNTLEALSKDPLLERLGIPQLKQK